MQEIGRDYENMYKIQCINVFFSLVPVFSIKRPNKTMVMTCIFILEYFPKISPEINSMHPFCPFLIPNTPYVIFFFYFTLHWLYVGPNNL